MSPKCDVCQAEGKETPAVYDARLPGVGGRWGYVCELHFQAFGPGRLGVGHGTVLPPMDAIGSAEAGKPLPKEKD